MAQEWRRIAERAFDRAGINKNRIITVGLQGSALSVKYFLGPEGKTRLQEITIPFSDATTEGLIDSLVRELAKRHSSE